MAYRVWRMQKLQHQALVGDLMGGGVSDCFSMIEIAIMNEIEICFCTLSLSMVLNINTSNSIVGSSIHAHLQS
jgi:hypothetical protein